MSGLVIKLVGLANDSTHALAGRYVASYDATIGADGVMLETTEDIGAALHFADLADAAAFWRSVSPKPLTAFSIELVPV